MKLDDPHAAAAPDLESWFACLDELLRRATGANVVVLDLTGARPDAGRRRRVFDWAVANRKAYLERIRAAAIVAPSPLLRGVLTAARWFLPMTIRHEIFDHVDPALAWAREEWRRG
ncbi:MAG: hypothetical protein IT376_16230 [Polyangiaceae bacterium]|nr:hypothetical protein [Polyangiaceae bacterium]